MNIDRKDVTAIVLCGGQGARLNGEDKPLLRLGKRQIVDYILDLLASQVICSLISCSRNVALYEAKGHPVVVDTDIERGPLAGLCESFYCVKTEWVLTVPGDSPFLPVNLVSALAIDALNHGIAVPDNGEHRQNLCLLLNQEARKDLLQFYNSGGIAVKYWLDLREVQATDMADQAQSFYNINTNEDLRLAQQKVK